MTLRCSPSGLATRARTGHLIDRFRDRLVLPIRTHAGDIVAFIGRAHPGADSDRIPRYLNSPDTALYTKSQHLYGLHEAGVHLARGARPVLVEGPLDAIAVTTGTAGRCAGIALCGTALTHAHLDALTAIVDLRQRGLVVATDPDEAGLAAAAKALTLLAGCGLSATAAALPPGDDPADTLHTHGPAALTCCATGPRGTAGGRRRRPPHRPMEDRAVHPSKAASVPSATSPRS